jgi:hypothetical protein
VRETVQGNGEEAVHLGFNFNVPNAKLRMDMPWSVMSPDQDQTVHANKNVYPTVAARNRDAAYFFLATVTQR